MISTTLKDQTNTLAEELRELKSRAEPGNKKH